VDFVAVVEQAITLLRQRGRVTYRTLQIQFTLDDEQLAALKDELLYSQPQVRDDTGRGLIWTDDSGSVRAGTAAPVEPPPRRSSPTPHPIWPRRSSPPAARSKASASRSPCCLPTSKAIPS
jgi:hypothetical protein